MMGGAADNPQRSSSPLKRRASDLDNQDEGESLAPASQKDDDVDMFMGTSTGSHQHTSKSTLDDSYPPTTETLTDRKDEGAQNAAVSKSAELKDDLPSYQIQIGAIRNMIAAEAEKQIEEGQKSYLVSRRWLGRILSRGEESRSKSKIEPQGEVGPIDNSDIVQRVIKDFEGNDFVQLKQGMGLEHFELFPQDVWGMALEWYGIMPGTIPIIRYAHNTSPDSEGLPNMQFELHPPIFTIHRLWAEGTPVHLSQKLRAANPPAIVYVASRSTIFTSFLRSAKTAAQIDLNKRVRVWSVPRLQPAAEPVAAIEGTSTPPPSRPNSPSAAAAAGTGPSAREPQDSWTSLLLDVPTFNEIERGAKEVVDATDYTNDAKYNGHTNLSFYGLGDSQTLVLDEQISGSDYISNYTPSNKKPSNALIHGASNLSKSQTRSGRSSPAPTSGPMTRGRSGAQTSGRTLGCVGLSNLGNTCYMNSALQCVRSVEELTKYFLTGASDDEINSENPLGNHGNVARAYGKLLGQIYAENVPSSVAPREFKNTIGRYAPSFSGYGQQDSQEFLGFLLDGLQEDLSRVKKKPYIEKPDSTDDMVSDPEAIRRMAAAVWDISKKRDDSVIADLFTGMYKSTVVCPVCAKVSITFDPFNNLTLQLPIESTWSHVVDFFPLNDRPIKITVDLNKQASFLVMKQYLSRKTGVPASKLFIAELFRSKYYRFYTDSKTPSEVVQSNDNIAVFELEDVPTNWPTPKSAIKRKKNKFSAFNNDSEDEEIPGWDDSMAAKMLVPVYHRYRTSESFNNKKSWAIGETTHFIILTAEDARDEDRIKRKILEKTLSFSTMDFDVDGDDFDDAASDAIDPELVMASGSSSVEGKTVANSVDGENELVDVTVKGPKSQQEEVLKPSYPGLKFNGRRPKFLQPGSFLPPQFQNIFELSYFVGTKHIVPTGWTELDEDKSYPLLSSRIPQTGVSTDATSNGSLESDEDDDLQLNNGTSVHTRMIEETSDEDELLGDTPIVPVALPVRTVGFGTKVGRKNRGKKIKTYSKKGQKLSKPITVENEPEAFDDGPLVRLGEGIVVDWNKNAWDSLFGGDSRDTMRGALTTTDIPTYDDPELKAKQKARQSRKRSGITLDDCLNEFGREEVLSEQDTWYCPRCKEHRRATKSLEIWRTPDILIMHLKRFSSSGLRRDKLDILVDFPIEGLDLRSRVIESQDGKEEVYDLFAVDDHWGGLGGGHYTAFAKNFNDGEWYEYNDTSTTKTKDLTKMISPSAYLLFYRRRSDVPLGGPRFQQIISKYDNSADVSEEEETVESGEGRGLVTNSSPRGSSSALTAGVGAARPLTSHGSNGEQTTTTNLKERDGLPDYASLDQMELDNVQPSIEDEGIGMDYVQEPVFKQAWSFDKTHDNPFASVDGHHVSDAGSSAAAGMDDVFEAEGSDFVERNSSPTSEILADRVRDFGSAVADINEFEEPTPIPDIDDDRLDVYEISQDILASKLAHPRTGTVAREEVYNLVGGVSSDAAVNDEDDGEAIEIHVEEGEGLLPKTD